MVLTLFLAGRYRRAAVHRGPHRGVRRLWFLGGWCGSIPRPPPARSYLCSWTGQVSPRSGTVGVEGRDGRLRGADLV